DLQPVRRCPDMPRRCDPFGRRALDGQRCCSCIGACLPACLLDLLESLLLFVLGDLLVGDGIAPLGEHGLDLVPRLPRLCQSDFRVGADNDGVDLAAALPADFPTAGAARSYDAEQAAAGIESV